MTLGTTPPVTDYLEDGVTLPHAIPFQFRVAGDIHCSRIVGGVETLLTQGADFTVAGGGGGTGTVTKMSAGVVGTTFRIKRVTSRAQTTDYTPGDAFPAEVHEAALDHAAAVDQEQDASISDVENRSLRLSAGEVAAALSPAARRGMVLTFADDAAAAPALVPKGSFPPGPGGTIEISGIVFVTPQQHGALANGIADDTAAIQGAVDAVAAAGGSKVLSIPKPAAGAFYKCDGQLNLESTLGLTILGPGGRVEPVTDAAPCAIVYTGTATSFIKAGKSHGLTIDGLAIQVSNPAFTGDIVTTDNDGAGGAVTYSTSITNCMIGGRTAAARHARSCINAQGAIELFVDQNTFGWADHHIIPHAADGLSTFSNAVTITRNRFNQHNVHAVNIFKGDQWLIDANVFEQQFGGAGPNGVAAGISDIEVGGATHGPCSAVITNNGFWDCDSGIWIDIYAWGQTISGNRCTLGAGATFVRYNGGVGGRLSSNRINGLAGSKFMDFAVAPVTGLDEGPNLVDGVVTYNANLTGFTPPDRAARDMSLRSSSATAVGGVGGFFHARKAAAGAGAFGGGFYGDRNDDVNWRGYGVFSYLDPATNKECIAFTVAAAVTPPTDTSTIRMLLGQSGEIMVPEAAAASIGTPAAGWQVLFIDTADHKLKRKDSAALVTVIA